MLTFTREFCILLKMSMYLSEPIVPFTTEGGIPHHDPAIASMTAPPKVKAYFEEYIWEYDIFWAARSLGDGRSSETPFDTVSYHRYRICGKLKKGDKNYVQTSYIHRANNRVAMTESGSFYKLGTLVSQKDFFS